MIVKEGKKLPYRQLKPKQAQEQEPIEAELTPEQMAAYIRQSTTKQTKENLESADLQLSGAQRYAVSQGLDADKIVVAHEGEGKRGVSGTLRIEERDRLRDTFAGIKAGTVKVVWAYSVSRLFRDRYGVQVATFIEACAEHNVKVVIETAKIFDFSNSFDIMLFQFLANVAARENEDRSKLLHDANNSRARRGLYNGKPLQPGYIIDRNKDSETYMRYTPYRPHAEVTARLYKRFRELSGQFNLLVAEVGQMPVVFPPFEAWVDQRDVNQLKLKKVCKLHGKLCDCKQEDCELAGYHITKTGLLHLLTAIEHIGYWKFNGELLTDADGQPLKNHEAIVPLDDWQFAFNRLSFVTLSGENNTERISTKTWVPAKKVQTTLLEGILTSPLGTIQCSEGKYKVTEKRAGKLHRSNTLTVPTLWIDAAFRDRLRQRLLEDLTGNKRFLHEQLKRIKASNAEALVSVDEQIANYQKAIANREAYIATVGAAIDKETALKLNADSIQDRAQLAALIAKKNAANKEVSGVEELIDRIGKFTAKPGKHILKTKTGKDFFREGDEETRRFIRLATESVELGEYSGHVLTLTIRWRAPFAQTDVCYIYRQEAGHQAWSAEDEQVLRDLFPHADRLAIMQALPTRSWQSIATWANRLGIERNTRLNTSGVHDTRLCWLDAQLLQEHGWKLEGLPHEILWDIGVLDSASAPGRHLSRSSNRSARQSDTYRVL
jgi:DNA invertase Pin-like site-specific DNA recombinase